MDLQLSGRVAVVTGASRGIGLAVTRTLVAEGARVVAASRTTSSELGELGDRVSHVAVDFMDPDAPHQAVEHAVATFGGLDVLVNNAGGPAPGAPVPHEGFLSRSDQQWASMFELNFFSCVRACRAAVPVMLERGGGAIVNVSSVIGRQPAVINADYAAAKAAMINLTKALSEEFAPRGVRVNGVCPGPTRTPWWTGDAGVGELFAAQAGTDKDTAISTLAPQTMRLSTGRLAEAQEIADVVALLASPRSASTTGAEFVVDSGMLKTT